MIAIFAFGKIFKFQTPDILIASNANIGNAATAAAAATAAGPKDPNALPARLAAIIPNGTPIPATNTGVVKPVGEKRRGRPPKNTKT